MWFSGMLLEVLVMLNPEFKVFTLWPFFSLSGGVHRVLLCTPVAEPTDLAMVL